MVMMRRFLSILGGVLFGLIFPATFIILDLKELSMSFDYKNIVWVIESQNLYMFSFFSFPLLFGILFALFHELYILNQRVIKSELLIKNKNEIISEMTLGKSLEFIVKEVELFFKTMSTCEVFLDIFIFHEVENSLKQVLKKDYKDLGAIKNPFNQKYFEANSFNSSEIVTGDHVLATLSADDFDKKILVLKDSFFVFLLDSKRNFRGFFVFKYFSSLNYLHEQEDLIANIVSLLELILEREYKEDLLNSAEKQAIQSSKMVALGEMAAGMAHEINNPLNVILSSATVIDKIMKKENIINESLAKNLKRVQETSIRIAKIVEGLRAFSRDTERDEFQLVSVAHLFEVTLDLCAEKAKKVGVEVHSENPSAEMEVMCKEVQIVQVLVNLVGNAIDAADNLEEKWVEIDYTFSLEMNLLEIFVTDSGNGIPVEVAEKMMQPFYTTKSINKGTGLGLSLSLGLVQEHGGNLYYDEDHPHTRFVIELPIKHRSLEKKV